MGIWYATREDVKSALDVKETARNNAQIDRQLEAASRAVEGLTHRKFYPIIATRYFDWPNQSASRSWRLWLDENELISVTSLVSGGDTISSSEYFLEPANYGPPFTHVEMDLSSSSSFNSGQTHQRSIAITGLFGYTDDSTPAGALAEALDNSETGVDVTDVSNIGVGSVIKVGTERMVVTAKSWLDTTQNLQNVTLTANNGDVTVTVTTGSAFAAGEMILIDEEKMLIVDVAGNNLIVKRAWDGSVLATHSQNTDVYAQRTLTVERGALGTTAATHNSSDAITVWAVPGMVRQLTIAEAMTALQQEGSAYGRVIGSGDNQREATGKGLDDLRDQVYTRHGRKVRMRVI